MKIINGGSRFSVSKVGKPVVFEGYSVSDNVIADEQFIAAIMKIRGPKELGILIDSSIEMDIIRGNKFTDGDGKVRYIKSRFFPENYMDYIYTDLESAEEAVLNPALKELDRVKEEKLRVVNEAQELIDLRAYKSSMDIKYQNLVNLSKDLSETNKKLSEELVNSDKSSKSIISDLTKLVDSHKSKISELESSLKYKDELIAAKNDSINELKGRVESIESCNKELTSDLEQATTDNDRLQVELGKANTLIDNMRAEFNAACQLFGLRKNDNGEWYQIVDESIPGCG